MLEHGDTDYNYHKWESVKGTCTAWLIGRLNVAHLIMLRKVKFYRHMYFSPNIVVRSLFHTALLHSCNNDSLILIEVSIFAPRGSQ